MLIRPVIFDGWAKLFVTSSSVQRLVFGTGKPYEKSIKYVSFKSKPGYYSTSVKAEGFRTGIPNSHVLHAKGVFPGSYLAMCRCLVARLTRFQNEKNPLMVVHEGIWHSIKPGLYRGV
jgi:hypothetical protein